MHLWCFHVSLITSLLTNWMHNLSGHSLLVNIRCKVLLTPFQLTWRDSRLNVKIWCNFGFAASAQPFFSQISVCIYIYIYMYVCTCAAVLWFRAAVTVWRSTEPQTAERSGSVTSSRSCWLILARCVPSVSGPMLLQHMPGWVESTRVDTANAQTHMLYHV